MITLNDYLYSGDTIFRILQKYTTDLRKDAKKHRNEIDMMHCNFLVQIRELLEHNDFLTAQSRKITEFYKYMAKEYPYLAFTFKGRIKSLIRAEQKVQQLCSGVHLSLLRGTWNLSVCISAEDKTQLLSRPDRLSDRDLYAEVSL